MQKIILASSSPRRKEILKGLHIPYKVIIPDINEDLIRSDNCEELASLIAKEKVLAVTKKVKNNKMLILGVDTIVVLENTIFGKPKNIEDAAKTLQILSGKIHKVISGVALLQNSTSKIQMKTAISEVKFKKMSKEEIMFYIETGEWKGVAGAYRIQGRASFFIEWIRGSYSNIVGLPISVFYEMLITNKYNFSKNYKV